MKNLLLIFFIALLAASHGIYSKEISEITNAKVTEVKIKLIFNDTVLTAVINNTPTARDFLSLLPLTLDLKDYNGTEKISYLPRKLSLKDAPSGCDPHPGDITYYSPWGNIAIFYKDFGYSGGLIRIGKIEGNTGYLAKWKESKTVRIEYGDAGK